MILDMSFFLSSYDDSFLINDDSWIVSHIYTQKQKNDNKFPHVANFAT